MAELVDVFPTLAALAGLPKSETDKLMPRLSGLSLAPVIKSHDGSAHVKRFALTQFARCPITRYVRTK